MTQQVPSIHQFLSWLQAWRGASLGHIEGWRREEIPLKEWLQTQADLHGVGPNAINMRIRRKKMARPPMRVENKRVIFVRVER